MTGLVVPLMDSRDQLEVLARAYSFWFDLPAEPEMLARFKAQKVPTFSEAFAAKYGVPLTEFFLTLFTLNLAFQAHAVRGQSPLLLDEAGDLYPTFGAENVRKVLSAVSQTPDTLALRVYP